MNAPLPKPIQRSIEAAASAQTAIAQQVTPATAVMDDPAQLLAAAPAAPVATATPVAGDPASATPPTNTAQQPPKGDEWEQKFRSMQGRYQAALAESQASNAQMKSQMAQLMQQVEALTTAAKAAEKATKPAADPKDVENFGADMIEMVQRYAEQMFRGVSDQFGQSMQALTGRVAELEKAVSGVSSRTEMTLEQQFYAALGAAVPEWEQINVDDRWLRWLAEADPVYGVPRQASLDESRNRLDVQRVVAIFNEFKRTLPAKPAPQSLANQVAPNGAATPAPASLPDKPILSHKFVEKFYNDKAKGRVPEADAARIEAEINSAAAEGRIR